MTKREYIIGEYYNNVNIEQQKLTKNSNNQIIKKQATSRRIARISMIYKEHSSPSLSKWEKKKTYIAGDKPADIVLNKINDNGVVYCREEDEAEYTQKLKMHIAKLYTNEISNLTQSLAKLLTEM